MSFDFFMSSYRKGEFYSYDRSVAEAIFEPLIGSRDGYGWQITGSFTFIYIEDLPQIHGFCVNRPSADPALWAAIFQVLQQTPSVCYWPASKGVHACVADNGVVAEMPPSMVKALGEIALVSDGMQILELVQKN